MLEAICRACGPILQGFSSKDREASVIRAVEAALMPAELHRVPGVEVAVSYTSATEAAHLGGDFYDVIELGDKGLLFVVGDYSGRGIGAAGMAARCRHAIASAASAHESPGAVLAAAQSALGGTFPQGKFATVVACLYQPHERLEGVLAGHHRPIVLEPVGGMSELELPYNPPIGQSEKNAFRSGSTHLSPGQSLLLYTDGITESRRDGCFFGLEGIAAHWLGSCDCSPADFVAGLCRVSGEFHEEGLAGDDRLALAIRLGDEPILIEPGRRGGGHDLAIVLLRSRPSRSVS